VYASAALALGLAYVASSAWFALRETHSRARAVLFTSLVYVPALFSIVLMDPLVRIASGHASP
jgi:heme O synthase-like polyprenyltransferase